MLQGENHSVISISLTIVMTGGSEAMYLFSGVCSRANLSQRAATAHTQTIGHVHGAARVIIRYGKESSFSFK